MHLCSYGKFLCALMVSAAGIVYAIAILPTLAGIARCASAQTSPQHTESIKLCRHQVEREYSEMRRRSRRCDEYMGFYRDRVHSNLISTWGRDRKCGIDKEELSRMLGRRVVGIMAPSTGGSKYFCILFHLMKHLRAGRSNEIYRRLFFARDDVFEKTGDEAVMYFEFCMKAQDWIERDNIGFKSYSKARVERIMFYLRVYVAQLAVMDMRTQSPRPSSAEADARISRILREDLSHEDAALLGKRLGISIREFAIGDGGVPERIGSAALDVEDREVIGLLDDRGIWMTAVVEDSESSLDE
jgi:hypothetical protein